MAVVGLFAAALIWPYLPVLRATPIPVWLIVGLVGYYARGNFIDAALFVALHVCAEFFGEPFVDANALAMLTLGLLALSGRPRFALLTGIAIFALFLACADLKLRFAGSVLTWQDLHFFFRQFADNMGVASSQPTLVMYAVGASLALLSTAMISWRFDGGKSRASLKGCRPSRRHHAARVLAAMMAAWCASELWILGKSSSQRSAWLFSEVQRSGPVSTFMSTLHLKAVAQYEKADTAQFARDVQALQRDSPGAGSGADIVLFLQESQFNPMAIVGCPASLCASGAFESDAATTDHGKLRVHVFGGGTWLTEFSLATGVPHTIFGRAGEYAPFNVAPAVSRSFMRSLKAAGYHTVAVYPVRGGMMNARIAYRAYGFDEFLDANDLGMPGGFDTSDEAMHAAALRTLKRARETGKPVFLLTVTIFNHGEHGIATGRLPKGLKEQAHQVIGPAVEANNLADYVWRTREFGKAYEQTRKAVLGEARPAVLAWFGDHQPPFATAPKLRALIRDSVEDPRVPQEFLTWYHIATNGQRHDTGPQAHQVDVVFLPGLLAQRAGAALDEWLAANVLARERCDGLLRECADPTWRNVYYTYLLSDLNSFR
jgi:hypothetical protein